jgi:hypothetical protein
MFIPGTSEKVGSEKNITQKDATKKWKVKESDQLQCEGAASQLREEGNNRNEPPKVDKQAQKQAAAIAYSKARKK